MSTRSERTKNGWTPGGDHNRRSVKGASLQDMRRRRTRRKANDLYRRLTKNWGTENWE